ncbi:hypothetical protein GGQ73_003055 [Rhizobium skierniewicense]|uniref:Uncharacterized protein n=1 Tax=Rhizobium skierniewicense TaxID=984260 RepID=A0A7W6G428_9HYPH|nr:hypothetical protein [Rhizobium skierniewicense]MBB3947091.1 hypothetical protein [Rhizobium skierniewicense]
MSNADLKQRWADAQANVDELEEQRYELIRHTEQEYLAALDALDAVDKELGEVECLRCEACRAPIFEGDLYHGGDTPMCFECAPTYQSLIDEPEMFVDEDLEHADPDRLRAEYDAHIAKGGSPDDKLVAVHG